MSKNRHSPTLVLASSSPFRRMLLEKLGLPFATMSPDVDESKMKDESPEAYVQRLALAKAQACQDQYPDALIIGSDQCAVIDGHILGKPGTHAKAQTQLRMASGKQVVFHTGLCLLNSSNNQHHIKDVQFRVKFRHLSDAEIDNYLNREQPYNCAGSFKSEGLGITLFESMEGEDPNALIGLPLIELNRMLIHEGCNPLLAQS